MTRPTTVTVYPVPRAWIDGIPAQATTTDAATAEELVLTGAFTYTAPDDEAPPTVPPEDAPAEAKETDA